MSKTSELWTDTGDVDPVLARMLHLLRTFWGSNPDDARALEELGDVVAGTRSDDALSRRRAIFVVDHAIRRDLPQLLRSGPRGSATMAAANRLENLAPLEDSRSAGHAVGLTFDLDRHVDGVDHHIMRAAWNAARHVEQAFVMDRIYQFGSAAVSACEMFIWRRDDLSELGDWTAARDLARSLAIAAISEAARGLARSLAIAVISEAARHTMEPV